MREPSLLSTASSVSRWIWTLVGGAMCAIAIAKPQSISQPDFDIIGLGRVGLAGDFNGVSLYEYTGQAQTSPFSNGSQSLLTQLPNGLFTSLGIADSSINAMCLYETKDRIKGIVVGGNFTSLKNVEAKGIALYDIDKDEVTAMGDFNGKVFTLLCDKNTESVYVGGVFSHNKSENAIVWQNDSWTDLPFEGFNSLVRTITRSNNDSILFGGTFDSLQNFSSPKIKNAQTINLVSPSITALQTIDMPGFNDPKAITCTNDTQKQWLVKDQSKDGSWSAKFQFEFKPTKLRLINADYEGRGTKIFRFTAVSLNAIMNLTYVDPKTGTSNYCDAWCPLQEGSKPQDFEFVNNIGMKDFRLDILEYYGQGGGLSSVQLFQDDIYSYAISDLNEPKCAAERVRSNSTVNGDWEQINLPQTDSYLSTTYRTGDSREIDFVPHLQQSGTYDVVIYTPGCVYDGSCAQRGLVVVSGVVTKDGKEMAPVIITQTNNFDKWDPLYTVHVDAADGNFKPHIVLKPAASQPQQTVTLVAQSVKFKLKGASTNDGDTSSSDDNSTSTLNGLYEYRLTDKKTTAPALSKTSSAGLNLENGAEVSSILVNGDITYVAGNFTAKDDSYQNFLALDKAGELLDIPEGGLQGPVDALLQVGDLIYVGGSFSETKQNKTTGLGRICAYDTKNNTWVALGGGVNGAVSNVVTVGLNLAGDREDGIAVSGDFTRIQPESQSASSIEAKGFAVWVPSQKKWLASMDTTVSMSGVLSAAVKSGETTLYSGSISSNTLSSSGVVYLTDVGAAEVNLEPSDFHFTESQSTSSKHKRDVASMGTSGVSTGIFYTKNDKTYTILGGKFVAESSSGTVSNLAFIDENNGNITGATTNDFTAASTILALQVLENQLFVGGSLEGTNEIGGLAVWNLDEMRLSSDQPPRLSMENGTGIVYSITNKPKTNDLYVAGDFLEAGSLSCGGLCIYKNDEKQWEEAATDSAGKIYVSHWKGKDLLYVGGDMTLNDTATYLALFDASSSTYKSIPGAEDIPGPVTTLTMGSEDRETLFISGTRPDEAPFLMHYKDSKFTMLDDKFDKSSKIEYLQVLNLKTSHASTDTLDGANILVITGLLHLADFGNASAVTYDGTTWKPLILATTGDGQPGSVSTLFSQFEMQFPGSKSPMARGFVILISLAIALALVFLIVVIGVAASYIRRRREGYVPAPTMAGTEKSVAMQEILRPQDLFTHNIRPGSGRSPMI
ncbi:cortical protein marker for cell polarity-domain-containing protein [Geopyxis carbonaria]|nr:cortical protein marker for cell polarity-domain-containing protein [Geopyxis carbonaria]